MTAIIHRIAPFAIIGAIATFVFQGEGGGNAVPSSSAIAPIEDQNDGSSDSSFSLPKPGGGTANWETPAPGPSFDEGRTEEAGSFTRVTSFETALKSTTEFWSGHIDGYRPPRLEIYQGASSTTCISGDPIRQYAFYCSRDEGVFFNQLFINEMPDKESLYQVVAHEVAHHVQHLTGRHRGWDKASTNQNEDEADCLAGVWVGWVIENGNEPHPDWLSLINDKWQIYQSIWGVLNLEKAGTHSEPTVRKQIFMKGVNGGLSACGW